MNPHKPIQERYASALAELQAVGQEHVLTHYEQLDDASRHVLLDQIESVDWPEVTRLIQTHVKQKPTFELPEDLAPAPWYPREPTPELAMKYQLAQQTGERLLREHKVAAFTVAGGQGSRLGWDHPKGTFPATPIREAPLFQVFAEYIQRAQQKYSTTIPWYVMTSPINHESTKAFFKKHDFFGLRPENVMLFPQAMMPAIDMDSHRVLLEAPDAIALSPNGHGGSLKALWTSGAIEDMQKRGIEQISYIQVDNPTVHVVDPLFLGLHAIDHAQMSSKMLPKREPMEKLGNFCLSGGKVRVIEYSNLPEEYARQRNESGELRFQAGSIAIHVIRVDFVESLNNQPGGFSLPWNRAEKKIAFISDEGLPHQPTEPNAVKLETFVFDALPLCETSIVYETDRVEEFAPIKNADGPNCEDCPSSSKRLQSERAARWLEQAGVEVPRTGQGEVDAVIEISPKRAIGPDDLEDVALPSAIERGDRWLLDGE
ncbi:MAG: UTP--glucose-1-phosphate uridylyltransferase [Phycisphaeraceae bacterium]